MNFAVDFLVDFLGPFSLEKTGGKYPPKNPRQFSNQNLGVSGPKSTLQGSGLEQLFLEFFGLQRELSCLQLKFLLTVGMCV